MTYGWCTECEMAKVICRGGIYYCPHCLAEYSKDIEDDM